MARPNGYVPLDWSGPSKLLPAEQEAVEVQRRDLYRRGVRKEPLLTEMAFAFAAVICGASPYREHRADGWPMCPSCGNDELYSLDTPATVETIVGCYACNWKPKGG